jgi:tetraacyldisaccharide 4'-kinase
VRIPWIEGEREEGAGLRAALLPLDARALVDGAAARANRALHARGGLGRERLGCRVLSVGNPGVGGSGKTPVTAFLARELRRRGHRVAIASRGYRRRGREPVVVVSDGTHLLATVEEAGDEPVLLAAHAAGIPVVVAERRALAGQRAIASFGCDVLILDDGFHHLPLERDVEVVVLDGRFGLGNARVLPRGPLREPLGSLRLADAIGVVDGPLDPRDEARLQRFAPAARRFDARRVPVYLRPLAGGVRQPPALLAGREVGVLSGIARPQALRRSVEALGAAVVAERIFRDHHRYTPRDLEGVAKQAPLWVTTEKDALKIQPAWTGAAPVWVLVIELEVESAAGLLDWLSARLR